MRNGLCETRKQWEQYCYSRQSASREYVHTNLHNNARKEINNILESKHQNQGGSRGTPVDESHNRSAKLENYANP